MNPLRRLDAFHREHPFASDAIVAGLLFVFLVLIPAVLVGWTAGIFTGPHVPTSLVLLDLLWDSILLGAWAFRRRSPLPAIRTAVAVCLVILLVGPDFSLSLFAVPMFVHHAAATFSRRASFTVLGIALAGAVAIGVKNAWLPRMALVSGVSIPGDVAPAVFLAMAIPCAAVVLAAWAFGDVARTRLIALQAVQDRARRLEVQAEQERELAAADERNRIAREMHDIVSHSLQVMISQADGARYAAAARPELAVQALETISGAGRSALAEMRALLGVLRSPSPASDSPSSGSLTSDGTGPDSPVDGRHSAPGPERRAGAHTPGEGPSSGRRSETALLRPQPRLADLEELAATLRLSGLEVTVSTVGAPRRALPAGGELAAYRIAQEALTNTLRHGGPDARARVTQTWTADGLELVVQDDGHGAAASPATAGTGHGLRGMAERARLFGGTLEAGPPASGVGWRVTAALPYEAR
jgi:signal transduction histidine kinase